MNSFNEFDRTPDNSGRVKKWVYLRERDRKKDTSDFFTSFLTIWLNIFGFSKIVFFFFNILSTLSKDIPYRSDNFIDCYTDANHN